jgi:hypothetical protein
MPKRRTSTTFTPGDPRAAEAARLATAARVRGAIPQTAAEKVVADLVALTPAAIEVLGAAVAQGDRKIAAYVVDRTAPPERLANIAAREQIEALRVAVEERDAQIDALEIALDEALATIDGLKRRDVKAA